MTKYVHIVQVHPVENGEVNLHKVKTEREFDTEADARSYEWNFNTDVKKKGFKLRAVYRGRVNDATGELE